MILRLATSAQRWSADWLHVQLFKFFAPSFPAFAAQSQLASAVISSKRSNARSFSFTLFIASPCVIEVAKLAAQRSGIGGDDYGSSLDGFQPTGGWPAVITLES